MNTNLQSDTSSVTPHIVVTNFNGNICRRAGNVRAVASEARVIKADQIFGSARVIRDAQAKQTLAETAQAAAENSAREAVASNKAKSDLLANVSHEIRTPMGAIIGLVNILLATQLDDKQKGYLMVLQTSAQDLMTMINDRLDIDKIESKTINLERAPFSMPALLHQIVGLMSCKAQEKDIGLTLHYDAALPKTFIGDSGRIRQIVTNLVGNAIKFTETGSVAIVFAGDDSENGKKKISISVTDTGMGIPEDKLDLIFERFTQADSSIVRKFGGSGLGLSISKALAESMGGSIGVASAIDKGSTFTLHPQLSGEDNGRLVNRGP